MKILHKIRGLLRESEATCLFGNKYLFIKTCENQEKYYTLRRLIENPEDILTLKFT